MDYSGTLLGIGFVTVSVAGFCLLWMIFALDRRMGKVEAYPATFSMSRGPAVTDPWDGTILHKFTWCNVTNPPWDLISELRGKINGEEWMGVAAEAVLFLGASAVQSPSKPDGERWNITYTFKEKCITSRDCQYGWNHYFLVAGAPRGYPYGVTSDFDKLFVECSDTPEVKEEDNDHAEG